MLGDEVRQHVHLIAVFVRRGAFADEWTFVGTHAGPFRLPDGSELPPTGNRVEIRGMEVVQLRDGKIIANNLYYDTMGVAAQLGLLPEGATVWRYSGTLASSNADTL